MKSQSVDNPDELLPTRRSLIERLRNLDDQPSWREFFDTYWKLIYGAAIKAGLSDQCCHQAAGSCMQSRLGWRVCFGLLPARWGHDAVRLRTVRC